MPRVHLVNPSKQSFGVAVITPRWLYVLAAATGTRWGNPNIVDETLDPLDFDTIAAGDVIGIGIHTGNALRGYAIGVEARRRGAWVVYGGIHATLFADEAMSHGAAHAVVRGADDLVWAQVVEDCLAGHPLPIYEGGRIGGDQFASARWDLLPERRYMWASVQTVRGCPKHCSFCSVWRTDGQEPRQRGVDRVVREIVELRRLGFRFIALADDNFYPVTFEDIAQARRRADTTRLHELEAMREERFALMAKLAELPDDLVFYTQITMEAAEDTEFLDAMKRAKIRGALVGVESVTREGLKDVYKGFNLFGDELIARLRVFRRHGIHVLGSFIFGLPSDTAETFDATVALAEKADLTFAQFVLLTPFPGTVDFEKWAAEENRRGTTVDGVPITQHWLIPEGRRPRLYSAHPTMSLEEIRVGTQRAWDQFYSWTQVWQRSRVVESIRARVAFVLISKLYRQMYANTGIATDSARVQRSARWARWLGLACRRLFLGRPMPDLQFPGDQLKVATN
ncbi:MAG: B12-binding domain-containing radical SAM protein [Acidobacteria bacterium]|nr:B12-binding domain-containing radical SAM protein [Acidobacteriota bacterium]